MARYYIVRLTDTGDALGRETLDAPIDAVPSQFAATFPYTPAGKRAAQDLADASGLPDARVALVPRHLDDAERDRFAALLRAGVPLADAARRTRLETD